MIEAEPMTTEPSTINEKQTVLLGLIAEEPIHAYGLEDKIRSRYMTEWTAIGFSSIYRVLGQLEDIGLIDSHLEHEGQGATRKVFTINDRGRSALANAVLALLGDVRPLNNPFQVGLAFLVHAPRQQVVEQLRRRTAELERWVRELSVLANQPCADPPLSKRLILDHAMRHLRVEQEFLDEALRLVAEKEEAP